MFVDVRRTLRDAASAKYKRILRAGGSGVKTLAG